MNEAYLPERLNDFKRAYVVGGAGNTKEQSGKQKLARLGNIFRNKSSVLFNRLLHIK